jgi:hypothetical protein
VESDPRIADEELGVGVVCLFERHLLGVREEDAHQHSRGRALRGDRNGIDAVDWRTRDELDRVHRSFGGDAETRKDPEPAGVAPVGDRGDRREVDLAVDQPLVELGGDPTDLLHLGLELEEDGRHVHVGDAAETNHARTPFHRSTSL